MPHRGLTTAIHGDMYIQGWLAGAHRTVGGVPGVVCVGGCTQAAARPARSEPKAQSLRVARSLAEQTATIKWIATNASQTPPPTPSRKEANPPYTPLLPPPSPPHGYALTASTRPIPHLPPPSPFHQHLPSTGWHLASSPHLNLPSRSSCSLRHATRVPHRPQGSSRHSGHQRQLCAALHAGTTLDVRLLVVRTITRSWRRGQGEEGGGRKEDWATFLAPSPTAAARANVASTFADHNQTGAQHEPFAYRNPCART